MEEGWKLVDLGFGTLIKSMGIDSCKCRAGKHKGTRPGVMMSMVSRLSRSIDGLPWSRL